MALVNLPAEFSGNINISAYRVLFILLTLVRYRSLNILELNRHLHENPMIGRAYNSETLTKYINTLREVGCRIPRSTNRNDYCYELQRSPFTLQLEPQEISIAGKLLDLLSRQPDERLYMDYRDFLETLAWSAGTATLNDEPVEMVPFEDVSQQRERFNEFRRYCLESFTLEIDYRDGETVASFLLEPYELLERECRLLLIGLDRNSQEQRTLEVSQIEKVKQLPSKNRRPPTQTSVLFALYGRLAKSYRLYPDEKVVYRSDQEIQIRTRVTDRSGLTARLMKYGASCQILSPDSLRETVRNRIHEMLLALEASTETLYGQEGLI